MFEEQASARADDVGAALARLLSHDLRSPLGPLVLAVSAIGSDPSVAADVRELATFAQLQCDRMARLITATVTAVRGAGIPTTQPVDLVDLVEHAMATFVGLGGTGEVTVEEHVEVKADVKNVTDTLVGLLEAAGGDGLDAIATVTAEGPYGVVRITGSGRTIGKIVEASLPDSALAVGILAARAVLGAHGGELRATFGGLEVLLPKAVQA